jgi:regulatory protein
VNLDDAAAYEAALRLIAYRDRTVHELRTRLAQKGYAADVTDAAIARLKRIGYLDDAAFCERYITETLTSHPAGPRFITARLRLKGVHPDVIRAALERAYPVEAAGEMAYLVAAQRARRYRRDEPAARRRKLAGFLSRRGFDYGDVEKALRRVLGELDDEEQETPEK